MTIDWAFAGQLAVVAIAAMAISYVIARATHRR